MSRNVLHPRTTRGAGSRDLQTVLTSMGPRQDSCHRSHRTHPSRQCPSIQRPPCEAPTPTDSCVLSWTQPLASFSSQPRPPLSRLYIRNNRSFRTEGTHCGCGCAAFGVCLRRGGMGSAGTCQRMLFCWRSGPCFARPSREGILRGHEVRKRNEGFFRIETEINARPRLANVRCVHNEVLSQGVKPFLKNKLSTGCGFPPPQQAAARCLWRLLPHGGGHSPRVHAIPVAHRGYSKCRVCNASRVVSGPTAGY